MRQVKLSEILPAGLRTRAHACGAACAAGVGALALAGVVDQYPLVVAGIAYIAGWGALWSPKTLRVPVREDLLEQVAWLRVKALPRVSGEARYRLERVLALAEELAPRLQLLKQQGLLELEQRVLLRQTLTVLLPGTLNAYLQLPSQQAKTVIVTEGKTAEQLLAEQFGRVELSLAQIRDAAFSEDSEALVLSGRLLEQRLREFDDRTTHKLR